MSQPSEEKLKNIKRVESGINRHLFLICAGLTFVTLIIALAEFFSRGAFPPSRINFFYIGILLLYSVHKEMLRWLEEKEMERQGEWFVYAWIGLAVVLYIVNFFTSNYFTYSPEGMPLNSLQEISITALEVCGIFILTRLSKVIKVSLER